MTEMWSLLYLRLQEVNGLILLILKKNLIDARSYTRKKIMGWLSKNFDIQGVVYY